MDDINRRHSLFQLSPSTRDISDEEILDDIKRVAGFQLPKPITYRDYKTFGRVSVGTLERRFGSWEQCSIRAWASSNGITAFQKRRAL